MGDTGNSPAHGSQILRLQHFPLLFFLPLPQPADEKAEDIEECNLEYVAEIVTGNPAREKKNIGQVKDGNGERRGQSAFNAEPETGKDDRQEKKFPEKNVTGELQMISPVMKEGDADHQKSDQGKSENIFIGARHNFHNTGPYGSCSSISTAAV